MSYMENNEASGTEAQAIIDLASKIPAELPGNPRGLVVVNGTVVDFRHMLPVDHIVATRRTDTADAFVSLVNASNLDDDTPVVFADVDNTRFECVIDYDEVGRGAKLDEHRIEYRPKLDPAWAAWAHAHGRAMSQVDFAEFVEERIQEITEPDGADLLELVQDLRGHRNVEFQFGKRLSDGQTQLKYVEKLETKGASGAGLVTVPDRLVVEVPVFRGGEVQTLYLFLRFRITNEGELSFTVKLQRQDDIVPEAFEALTLEVKQGLADVPVYAGWHSA